MIIEGKLLWGQKNLNQRFFIRHTIYVHCSGIEFGALVVRSRRQTAFILAQTDVIFSA
jgi:hypothetical protein